MIDKSFDIIYSKQVSSLLQLRKAISSGWEPACIRACLKKHFRDLQAPLCGIFCPYSVDVAPLRRPHSSKIFHKLELAAHKKPFSNTL